jgi:RNA polymerase sigma factor (sigma-70 family)
MRDREVVASIVAGDPAGLAAAYDKYADALYGYARSFLREPSDAADIVHDTFVIAAASVNQLRDPERLRPWLYAVARSLCLRRLRADKAAAMYVAPEDIPEGVGEDSDELGGEAERAELRALLRAAGGGLNPGERDIVELRLWQGLDAAEAAAVLGITRGHAHALLSRGRDQLTASLAALLVARTGRADCAELDHILSGWDGQLTVLMRKRLSRHIERCDICSDRRRRELRPALLVLWPAGVLASAALAERAMHAGSTPMALRAQVLQATASGTDIHAAAGAAGLGSQVRMVRQNGFPQPGAGPRPLALSRAVLRRGTHSHVTLWSAAAAAAALVGTGVFLSAYLTGQPGKSAVSAAGQGHSRTSSGPGASGAVPPGSPGGRRGPGRSGSGGAAGRGGSGGRAVPVVTVKPGTSPAPGRSPGSTSSASGSLAAAGSAPASSAASSSAPSSAPASSAPASSAPSSSPSSSPPPSTAAGTLTVSPTSVVLTPLLGSTLTLTAENGPVSWSISEPASLLGELNVSPSSGTLAAGQSVRVSISVSGLASLDTTLTVNPGGQPVTVLLGLGL